MNKLCFRILAVSIGLCFAIAGSPGISAAAELVDLLTEKLGVTTEQAEGGAGAIFNQVKQKLSTEDFAKVSEAIPDLDSLMKAAPKAEEATGSLGSVTSMMQEKAGSMGGAADLAGNFSKLGLDAGMVGKFVPVVLDFANSKGGESVMNLLKGALPLP